MDSYDIVQDPLEGPVNPLAFIAMMLVIWLVCFSVAPFAWVANRLKGPR